MLIAGKGHETEQIRVLTARAACGAWRSTIVSTRGPRYEVYAVNAFWEAESLRESVRRRVGASGESGGGAGDGGGSGGLWCVDGYAHASGSGEVFVAIVGPNHDGHDHLAAGRCARRFGMLVVREGRRVAERGRLPGVIECCCGC